MADIKQVKVDGITYNLKDEAARQELALKQDAINEVSVNYTEDGGSPDASASLDEGELAFSLKNMKMKFSELTSAEKEEIRGPQGATGLYDPNDPNTPAYTLETTTGDSDTSAMTQKAVTDAVMTTRTVTKPGVTSAYIHPGNNVWASVSSIRCYLIPVTAGDLYIIKFTSEILDNTRFAFLTDTPYEIGEQPSYADNSTLIKPQLNEEYYITAPSNAAYLYVYARTSSSSTQSSVIKVKNYVKDVVERQESTLAQLANDVSNMQVVNTLGWDENVGVSQKTVTQAVTKIEDVTKPSMVNGFIHPVNAVWSIPAATSDIKCYLIPITAGEIYTLKFTGNILSNTRFAFLTTDVFSSGDTPAYAEGSVLTKPQANMEYFLTAPSNATHLYVYGRDSSSTVQASSIKKITLIGDVIEEHEVALAQLANDVAQIEASNVPADKLYAGKRAIGSAEWAELISNEKVIIVPVYGQSFAINTDGGYRVTSSFDSNLYKHKSASPTNTIIGAGDTEMRALTQGSSYEQLAAAFVQVLSRLIRQYCHTSQDMIVGAYGKGDTTILDLSEGSTQYDNVFAVGVQNAANAKLPSENTPREKSCPFILFLQGEADTSNDPTSCNGDKDLYKERFLTLKSQMQATVKEATGQEYDPVIFINTVGHASWNTQANGIQQAQVELAEENEDVFLVGSYYYMPTLYLNGASNPHLAPNGKRWLAEKFAQKVFEVMIKGEDNNMLIKEGAVSGKEIVLSLSVPEPPIVFDTWTVSEKSNYGFMVYDNNGGSLTELAIDSVVANNNKIILTLLEEPTAGAQLIVTYGNSDVDGKGNVRDSGAWRSLGLYTSNENTAGSTIPYDKDGGNIIGKRYPMQSWLPQCRIELTV